MNPKGFGRKRSCPIQGTIPELAWRNCSAVLEYQNSAIYTYHTIYSKIIFLSISPHREIFFKKVVDPIRIYILISYNKFLQNEEL
jgi:hypothetical protein